MCFFVSRCLPVPASLSAFFGGKRADDAAVGDGAVGAGYPERAKSSRQGQEGTLCGRAGTWCASEGLVEICFSACYLEEGVFLASGHRNKCRTPAPVFFVVLFCSSMIHTGATFAPKKKQHSTTIRLAQDEDLVDDTLDDVPLGTLDDQMAVGVVDVPPPPVDFDDNDGYDDGYDSDPGISGMESEGMY